MKGITDAIPQGAKATLLNRPELKAMFDKNFGQGTADYVLSHNEQYRR
jgi:hypothetical protein